MKILNVTQGSPQWHAIRSGRNAAGKRRRSASVAPVVMGESPHLRRTELIRMWATGDEHEFTEWEKKFLLEKGLEAEAAARPLLEEDLGEDFYLVTITDDVDEYLASMDGLQMGEEDGFEHKLWNEELVAAIRAGDPTPLVYWQLEAQFLAGEGRLKRIHLVCSDGTREKRVVLVYKPVPGRAKALRAAWKQFEEDVANYKHVEVIPAAVAAPMKDLPALAMKVEGAITIISNLDRFGVELEAFIEALPDHPSTDQDFADADAGCKALLRAQEALEAAESNALAQTASVDDMRRTVAKYRDLARSHRLMLEKLVAARKDAIRSDIRMDGVNAMAAHLQMLDTQLGGKRLMPAITPDFASVMKGKKTIVSLRDAVQTEVARCKIAANEVAGRITINLTALREQAQGYEALFADLPQIVVKESDHFALLVKSRVDEHKRAEEKKQDELREKIRAEEQAKLQAAAAPVSAVAAATPAPAPAPAAARLTAVPGGKPSRPTDDQIIDALAVHFRVHESQVVAWLLEVDLAAASNRMAKEFAR